jgi:hypothetical protein
MFLQQKVMMMMMMTMTDRQRQRHGGDNIYDLKTLGAVDYDSQLNTFLVYIKLNL